MFLSSKKVVRQYECIVTVLIKRFDYDYLMASVANEGHF